MATSIQCLLLASVSKVTGCDTYDIKDESNKRQRALLKAGLSLKILSEAVKDSASFLFSLQSLFLYISEVKKKEKDIKGSSRICITVDKSDLIKFGYLNSCPQLVGYKQLGSWDLLPVSSQSGAVSNKTEHKRSLTESS